MSSHSTTSALLQGFSIYQPALGAQLQFYPAVGTQRLDDLIDAFVPGFASAQEKRAAVSVDFFEHTHLTGEAFKFYPVYSLPSPSSVAASPATASSSLHDSVPSSYNVSPVTPNWDFSQVSAAGSSSSRRSSSTQARSSSSRKTASPPSRHATTDFSHLPGMQILTKDGIDVTNSASRGSKSKEQRDHAHLMRIIKACDSCKKKKIRCDPSHKKRGAASTSSSQMASSAQQQSERKQSRKSKPQPPRTARPVVAPVVVADDTASPFGLDPAYSSTMTEVWDPVLDQVEPWEQFVNYAPPADATYDFFFDPEEFLPQSFMATSSSSDSSSSPTASRSPASQPEQVSSYGYDTLNQILQTCRPSLPYHDHSGSAAAGEYADFNLYSPSSSFSEDERMVSLQSSSTRASSSSLGTTPREEWQSPGHASPGHASLHGPAALTDHEEASPLQLQTAGVMAANNTRTSNVHSPTDLGLDATCRPTQIGTLQSGLAREAATYATDLGATPSLVRQGGLAVQRALHAEALHNAPDQQSTRNVTEQQDVVDRGVYHASVERSPSVDVDSPVVVTADSPVIRRTQAVARTQAVNRTQAVTNIIQATGATPMAQTPSTLSTKVCRNFDSRLLTGTLAGASHEAFRSTNVGAEDVMTALSSNGIRATVPARNDLQLSARTELQVSAIARSPILADSSPCMSAPFGLQIHAAIMLAMLTSFIGVMLYLSKGLNTSPMLVAPLVAYLLQSQLHASIQPSSSLTKVSSVDGSSRKDRSGLMDLDGQVSRMVSLGARHKVFADHTPCLGTMVCT